MTLVSSVTAPLRARMRPLTLAPVLRVADVRARTVPTNCVPVPSVAELPTCQKTLQGEAPFVSRTELFDPVVRVEPARKTKTALGSPWASRVKAPLSPSEIGDE